MTPELERACERAIHLITPRGRVLRAGRACLCVLGLLGHPTLAIVLSVPPWVWFIELGYWIVARNRRLFSKLIFRE